MALLCLSTLLFGCLDRYDNSTGSGKEAIKDGTRAAIDAGDCARAISLIEGLYNSPYSDNSVRLLRASAHACNAGLNYWELLLQLGSGGTALCNSGLGSCSALWELTAEYFTDSTTDDKAESSWLANESIFSVLKDGAVITSTQSVNGSGYNPGSLEYTDRTVVSNNYLIYTALANIGAAQNRFGSPNASQNYAQGQDLPWTTSALIQASEEGCGVAGSILNMTDGLADLPSDIQGSFPEMKATLSTVLDAACDAGCQGLTGSGCTLAAGSCTPCPLRVRYRKACLDSSVAADKNTVACAAAGIIAFLNSDWTDEI